METYFFKFGVSELLTESQLSQLADHIESIGGYFSSRISKRLDYARTYAAILVSALWVPAIKISFDKSSYHVNSDGYFGKSFLWDGATIQAFKSILDTCFDLVETDHRNAPKEKKFTPSKHGNTQWKESRNKFFLYRAYSIYVLKSEIRNILIELGIPSELPLEAKHLFIKACKSLKNQKEAYTYFNKTNSESILNGLAAAETQAGIELDTDAGIIVEKEKGWKEKRSERYQSMTEGTNETIRVKKASGKHSQRQRIHFQTKAAIE